MKEYSMVIQWSEEDDGYIATIPELSGLSAFGITREEALQELEVAKEAYLEVSKEDGCELPEPDTLNSFSGQTRIRLPKSLHASLSREAKLEGVSLNTHIVYLLSERNISKRVERKIDEMHAGSQNLYIQHEVISYTPNEEFNQADTPISGSKNIFYLIESSKEDGKILH